MQTAAGISAGGAAAAEVAERRCRHGHLAHSRCRLIFVVPRREPAEFHPLQWRAGELTDLFGGGGSVEFSRPMSDDPPSPSPKSDHSLPDHPFSPPKGHHVGDDLPDIVRDPVIVLWARASDGCYYETKLGPDFEKPEMSFVRPAVHYPEVQYPEGFNLDLVEPLSAPWGYNLSDEDEDEGDSS
ncbi:hypothetical protein TorRG33x02_170690 [Trema orientale]|uniref:Uncharacterized protein n=1 Tax=Trema orientale TaxID=63057 RepID=A0A2P5ENJ3_TREOI|nr:hypothetical protein TorRG33x02_170690 [Trema orientale]